MGWIQAHFYRTVPLIHCHEVVYKDGPQANQAHTFIATPYSKCRPLGSKGRNSTCACSKTACRKNARIGQDLRYGASLFHSNESVCTAHYLEYHDKVVTELGAILILQDFLHSK